MQNRGNYFIQHHELLAWQCEEDHIIFATSPGGPGKKASSNN